MTCSEVVNNKPGAVIADEFLIFHYQIIYPNFHFHLTTLSGNCFRFVTFNSSFCLFCFFNHNDVASAAHLPSTADFVLFTHYFF